MLKRKVLSIAIGVGALVGASNLAYADEPYIPLISKGFQHQFWQAVKSGAEQSAKANNVRITFEGPETEAMVDKQIDMLSAALAKKPQALGIAALDSKAAIPLLKRAQSSKIPVIAFDSGVDSDIPLTTCATDNLAAAALAADKMAGMIGNSGEVGVIVHDQTSRTGIDRRDGFLNEMKSKHPNVKIVSVQYGGGDHLKSAEIAKAMIQANPNIKGIFGANEGSAEGAAIGVKESGKKLVLIGYDSGKEQKEDIMSGLMAGAITQNPVGIGKCVIDSAVKALKGEKLPKKVDTGFYWYDKTNINDPKIAAVLYD
ncbi:MULTISPECIES: ABC transporter substrate-binding protein [Paraburkholderia]|jgi:ribose transport system substrate-binding protein|uniref:BMP family ABC transporter substrate-binding protein n=1 Tax=Paraburkholderia hospita TaxID=169430 RepID=A0AAJ4SUQ7_9BURK|nr:ABC transporter substrate-binding protein [Paraburkholderia hospita]EUC12025.1 Periplasmic binding protein domain containing protein [Burkholderia sp. BT03]SKC95866.1 monosaccharide ABC transporter substrate-binding protein, CUT2 family [Burkholderia sp. CF099]SOE89876.1 monosaccharide ABC transporter substrate-binding protein, CUT2 family [Burkholderia sp. YR290]AUT74988.1 BMP family ABC transporter substrate-binding protein [Paraburkholderia hospita]EIM94854.1 periplasmic binding protein/